MHNDLEKIAMELSSQRLIPFIGAGASFPHLKLDWDILCSKMNVLTGVEEKDNLQAAQIFIDKFGRGAFANFLKENIFVNNFDDLLGENYLFLMSLNCFHYYTTNQDNVFERCLEKYQREYQVISTLDTFRNMIPNVQTIFKFHGDIKYPESIVFSYNDYSRRMPLSKELASYHPLDITLLADAITRKFLFIGYSFRDPNIREIFDHINRIFNGNPPESYLLQYIPDKEFANKMEKYNINCIDCTKYFPGISESQAYSATLAFLSNHAFGLKTTNEIDDIFSSDKFTLVSIKTSYEVDIFTGYLNETSDNIETIIEKFRSAFDTKNIPKDLSKKVEMVFLTIIERVDKKDLLMDIQGAIINLSMFDPGCVFNIIIAYFCKLNDFFEDDVFNSIHLFNVHAHIIPSKLNILLVAMALDKLLGQNKAVDNLLNYIIHSIHSSHDLDELQDDEKQYVRYHFDRAFNQTKNYSNPLNRDFSFGRRVSVEQIRDRMLNSLPKKDRDMP